MNQLQFLDLLREIFYTKKPNIQKIQKKGLLAVKIAQTFALRIDFLDEDVCVELSKLFNHVEKIPKEGIEDLLKQFRGEQFIPANFDTFNLEAFASASVGQVHMGTLKTGEKVAVKILKGQFKEKFNQDVEKVIRFFRWAIRLYPKLERVADPVGTLQSIQKFTVDELDLRKEQENRDILYGIYEKYKDRVDLSKVHFIEINEALSDENVMVSKFIEGETFDALLADGRMKYQTLLDFFHIHGFYIFGVGVFHGDIHPGNILLKGDDIYFVDCGAIGQVSDRLRKGLFYFMENLSLYQFDGCAHWLNQMSEVPLEDKKFQLFRDKLIRLYDDFENANVTQVSLTKRMMETIKMGVHAGMHFEQGMFPVIKSLMYMDGMVLRCNPKAVLMRDMRPFIDEFKRVL